MPRGIPNKPRKTKRLSKLSPAQEQILAGQNAIFSRLSAIEQSIGRLPLDVASVLARSEPAQPATDTPSPTGKVPESAGEQHRRASDFADAEFPMPPGFRVFKVRGPQELLDFLNSLNRR